MISAALVAALVGYSASIAVLVAGGEALGLTAAEQASWLLAICLGKAVGSAILSVWYRVPVILAWSTAGAALVAATEGVTLPEAAGAYVVSGLLVAATGAIAPLGRVLARIPDGVAGAMLAGVLLPFCLTGARAVPEAPVLVLGMAAVFVIVRLWNPAFATIAALAAGLALAFGTGGADLSGVTLPPPALVPVLPVFDWGTVLGLGLPLYLVTMASQNLPGFATLRAAGYEPPVSAALGMTGALSALTALAGAHTVSVAAITASICMGPDVHPDRDQRWRVALPYAAVWIALGLLSATILQILAVLPPQVMAALVTLALLGPLLGALTTGFTAPETRFPAALTLVVTASGLALFGVGSAFWGLAAGLAVWALDLAALRLRLRRSRA